MGSSFRPENPYTPKPKGSGTVTSGPLIPVGVNADDLAALSVGTPRERIALGLGLARAPLATQQAVAQRVRKVTAPGTLETAANLVTGNMIAPVSETAANAATEHDLDAYAQGGGNPAQHANLFGAASALGAVAGNTALAGTGRAAANAGSRVVAEAPVAKTALGRIAHGALSAGVTNAAIGAGSEAAFGDAHGERHVDDIVRTGLAQGIVGAAAGGLLGSVSEAAGALAKRLRPENPYAVHPVVEAAHDVAKEEAPDAIEQNVPTPTFRAENPYAIDADMRQARLYGRLAGNARGGMIDPLRHKQNPYQPSSPLHDEWEFGFEEAYNPLDVGSGLPEGVQLTPGGSLRHTDPERANAAQTASDAHAANALINSTRERRPPSGGAVADSVVSRGAKRGFFSSLFSRNAPSNAPAPAAPKHETILSAAVRLPSGRVVTGINHQQALESAVRAGLVHADWHPNYDFNDGWVTSNKRFVDRETGYTIAERAQQIRGGRGGGELTHDSFTGGGAQTRYADSVASRIGQRLTKQQMIAAGADGYLSSATRLDIPVDRIVGLEPTPAMEGGYVKGRPITQPIEVEHDPETGHYVLYSGNHRVTQAKINGDQTIPAFVENPPKTSGGGRTSRAGAVSPQLLARGGGAVLGGAAGATYGASQGDTPEEKAQLAAEYGALGAGAGLGLSTLASSPEARQALSSTYRQLLVTPYAKIEHDYPDLTDALHRAGAATQAAQHIATRRTGWVTEGLSGDQQRAFTNVLLRDTNLAKADAALARGETDAAQRFQQMAADHAANVPAGTENEQWFTDALDKHRQFIGQPLEDAAQRAGVTSVLPVQSAYLRGVSRDRLDNQELRRAMDARATTDPSKVQPRGRVAKALLGERPEVTRLERASGGIPQGPINPALPTQPTGAPPRSPGTTRTGSAKAAQGTAREYVSDYQTLVQRDAEDKIVRGATNDVYGQLDKAGFQRLKPDEDPPLGMQTLQRTVPDASGQPVQERWAVPKAVKDAVTHFEQKRGITDASGLWRKVTGAATRLQIAGMPVEATSHMNTLASIVASVPGEKDAAGSAMAAIPAVGAKAAAIREMAGIDFTKPDVRQLETRLADIGALRIEPHQGGLVNTSHNALFGPEGVDVRGRLVLARKYLAKKPNATDGELREFITSKLGNYSRANSGAAVNALQDAGISAFARFQAARIPSSVRSTFGASGLPTNGLRDRLSTIGQTLYRGPVGYAAAGEAANYALSGHGMQDNERGHQMDVQLPFTVGANNDPTYLPLAFTNPVLATGARVTGARDLVPFPGGPNMGGKVADAGRDIVNTGLGVLSPFARAASVGATGRTPYVLSDGSMLRVTNNRFDKGRQAADNLKAAVSLANPAMAAFAEQGGDLGGHRLSDALTEDGARFGGPKAVAAKAAEFLFPRVLTLGVGGRDNALSAESRDQREYMAAMQDYTAALRRAPGPLAQEAIIRQAVKDAERDGRFAPDVVEQDLRKVLEQDGGRAQDRRERSLTRWTDRHAQ